MTVQRIELSPRQTHPDDSPEDERGANSKNYPEDSPEDEIVRIYY